MKSHMYYMMGFYSVISHSKSPTATIKSYNETKLKLSCFIQNKLQACLLMTPALVYDPNSKQAEMLLISKSEYTESEWEVLTAGAIPANSFHLQTGILIEQDGAASCIDRLISNQVNIHRANNPLHNIDDIKIEEVLLDAHRIGTNGLMHHLDHRPWKMKKSNILRLHKLQDTLEASIVEGIEKRKIISRQIQLRQIIFEHANMFLQRDPAKYNDVVLEVLEDHDLEVKRLMDQEIDITSDMDVLFQRSAQIIKVLKKQVEIPTSQKQKRSKRKISSSGNNK